VMKKVTLKKKEGLKNQKNQQVKKKRVKIKSQKKRNLTIITVIIIKKSILTLMIKKEVLDLTQDTEEEMIHQKEVLLQDIIKVL